MKDPEAAILSSRYACIDFSEIHGFPNHFPKDAYFLRNGPKFNGEDLSLTLKHISDFFDFIKLLRVKHEDVCIMLFYDSFQGKCKRWIESFPAKSIKSFQHTLRGIEDPVESYGRLEPTVEAPRPPQKVTPVVPKFEPAQTNGTPVVNP